MKNKEIPSNLEECFETLNEILGAEQVKEFKSWEEDAVIDCHHGLGRSLRNDWGLWGGSSLQEYFKTMGVWHADDMSGIILDSYHRHLNNKPLDVKGQVAIYKNYWKNK